MASATQTPEQRELALIDKVELRIALADSDTKLEAILKTYLAPLLLKLGSEHVSVRNKLISICQHVSTRIKPQSIQLPVAALVKQFKEQESPLVRHFDLLYIQQGVDRLPATGKAELLPVVVGGISKSGSQGPQVFNLLLRLLEYFTLPLRGSKEDVAMREQFAVTDKDTAYLASWLGKFILFTPQKGTTTTCPGLNAEEYAFINLQGKENPWSPSAGGLNLLRTKTLAARLLSSGLFNDHERFLPALIASADPASNINDVGDDMMKRALPATDLEDEVLMKQLFGLYFGENGAPRVRAPLQLKILGLLNKSTHSTTFSHHIMRMVEDGVASPATDGDDVVMSNAPTSNATAGREATKLRSAIFQYVNFGARHGSTESLHAIAPRVIARLRDFIDNQGWPKPGPNEDLTSRGYAYEVIGLLAKAGPRNVLVEAEHPSLDLLRYLFESLAKDPSGSSIIVSIEEALSTVLSALSSIQLTIDEQGVLEDLFVDQMSQSADLDAHKRLRSTRYVTVRFANRCLRYGSIKARWIDILGVGAVGDRAEVREEAERGLSPYWYRMLNGSLGTTQQEHIEFPTFSAVICQFFQGHTTSKEAEPMAIAQQAKLAYPHCFQHMTTFARRILYHEAMSLSNAASGIDSEWERRVDAAAESDEKAREAIRAHLRTVEADSAGTVAVLLSALFLTVTDPTSITGSSSQLVELLSLSPDTLIASLLARTSELLPMITSNSHAKRVGASHTFGILASHPQSDATEIAGQVARLRTTVSKWDGATGAAANQVHGAVIALGYYYSRLAYRHHKPVRDDGFTSYLKEVTGIAASAKDNTLQEASHIVIGQLCLFGAVELDTLSKTVELRTLIDKLYSTAKGGNEAAILSLGQLSMILPEAAEKAENDMAYVEEQLHKLHEIRQAEVHFTVGEAISYLASGWQSTALATKLDIMGPKPERPVRAYTLGRVIDRILGDCTNTKPALKKAAVMWLLCLVQFCGHLPEIQERLEKCQVAFKRCLGDRDELVQETASRGLGLIYEKGDRRLKDDLVRDLVSSFSSDRQSQLAGNVSADTELFEPGQLPTGDGKSVSTYKEVMSLASEVGDSTLVYRFMSMASSNAIWSSRAAFGRFGLSNVLSDSSVDGYLADNPKLYPKLFRYRFDPNGGVQRSMNDIWNALVKDSTATIDKHFAAIIEDLLASILGKEWRVRQASCAAIADLVQGRPLDRYEQYLERIWTQCFKVLDDIKESVRAAAASLARVLTGVLTRALEADHSATKNASAMLKHVLPFLLSPSGMESSAQEVQSFSVRTLLEIIKKANGSTLRPFIPELVERLIGLLSSLEPEEVNYLHLNASKYKLTEQKIDDMRLSSVRSSPLMEAIERCLDLLDDETMLRLQPRLENAMKSALGLPSKVGAGRVLVSLSTRRLAVFRPFVDHFLRLVEKLIQDRNETVASSYAVAAGYLARAADDKQLIRLIDFARGLYFDSEGDRESTTPRRCITSGEIVYAFAKHAADRFNSVAAAVLPFVFVAKHDPNEQVKEQFQNAWNESVGGSRAVALYLTEIVALSDKHLDSPQWVLKHTSARAVADAVTVVASLEAKISKDTAAVIWPTLEKALGGKTWEGKEVVLAAFAKFVKSAAPEYVQRPGMSDTFVKIATREAKRQNATYKPHAVKYLGHISLALEDVDLSQTVVAIVKPIFEDASTGDPMAVDGEETDQKSHTLEHATLAAGVEALLASINPVGLSGERLALALSRSLAMVASLQTPPASVNRSTYTGLKQLFESVQKQGKGDVVDAAATLSLKDLLFGPDPGTEALRLLRADATVSAVKASPSLAAALGTSIQTALKDEKSLLVRDRLAQLAPATKE
ncbi:proteasome component M29 [Elasticomyces elasticus]|nr:proteasome component M29 [Elasticomyces elasticus]KAK3661800.1 proteasome component M29 [Elasticomyces elasticus]KAK4924404.1 proteasome component M29 [Elasticomyces elasticus]KAK5762631.1 proteasome component M29 [Elasticomyces elasticus]